MQDRSTSGCSTCPSPATTRDSSTFECETRPHFGLPTFSMVSVHHRWVGFCRRPWDIGQKSLFKLETGDSCQVMVTVERRTPTHSILMSKSRRDTCITSFEVRTRDARSWSSKVSTISYPRGRFRITVLVGPSIRFCEGRRLCIVLTVSAGSNPVAPLLPRFPTNRLYVFGSCTDLTCRPIFFMEATIKTSSESRRPSSSSRPERMALNYDEKR